MSLWAKAQQLPQDSVQLAQIRNIYGDTFPIEVRHYLAHSIEEKFWANIDPNNVDNDQYQMYIFNVVNQFIQEIEQKAEAAGSDTEFLLKLKLAETAKSFRDRYSAQPMQLFNYIRQCLAMEMKYLQQAGVDLIGGGPSLSVSHSASEILNHLDVIRRKTQETSEITRKLEQDQEAFALQYHDCTKLNAAIQAMDQAQLNPQMNMQQNLQTMIRRKEMLELDLQRKVALLMELRLALVEKLKQTYDMLVLVQTQILDEELIRWKRDQQLAGNGVPFNNYLDQIQDWCESLAELMWINRQQLKEVERLKAKLPLDTPGVNDQLPQLLADITQLLSTLVTTTFIIEKQPPQVMKTNTRFTATVRLLVGGKLNVHMTPPQVKVTIISEAQANLLLKNDNKLLKGQETSGEILNNTGTMEYQANTRQLSVSFRNMQLKKIKRAEKKGTESVMDEKFSLFFQSQFSIGGGELMFHVWTLSLPVVVIVHGNQEPHAWATVTWDNAFSEPERCPFVVPDKVPWIKMKETLSQKFKYATGRGLTEDSLRFLADKAFRGNYNESTNCLLSWGQFCKEPLSDRNFTFWEWFFAIMKLTREHLRGPWAEGAIMGFLKKKQAEDLLANCAPGTFLLRFSDSELGGITIAWVSENQEVFSLMPMTSKDFQIRSMADRILDLGHLVNLYPETNKEVMFRKYYTPPQETQQVGRTGYVPSHLMVHVPGFNGIGGCTPRNTPQHNWADSNRDTPSVGSSYNPGSVATAMASTPYPSCYSDFDDSYQNFDINFSELMDNGAMK